MSRTTVSRRRVTRRTVIILLIAGLAAACAACQGPTGYSDRLAAGQDARRELRAGEMFQHVIYQRASDSGIERLHVYIEGDGTPWVGGRFPAADPTARNPLALELMGRDTAPSVYLGRPCYLGTVSQTECTPRWWTFERFSPAVVSSMTAVLTGLLDEFPAAAVTLIGYSGGGVLALLIGNDTPRVDTVVTIAANLDTDAWTEAHGYLPLTGSINPADWRTWRDDLRQIHLIGAQDLQVPPATVDNFSRQNAGAEWHVFETFDHVCCWLDAWPDLLTRIVY